MLKELEDKLQSGRKYLQKTHSIKDRYPKYTNNFKLNNKETNKSIKMKPRTLTDTSQKMTYR